MLEIAKIPSLFISNIFDFQISQFLQENVAEPISYVSSYTALNAGGFSKLHLNVKMYFYLNMLGITWRIFNRRMLGIP